MKKFVGVKGDPFCPIESLKREAIFFDLMTFPDLPLIINT
jgi:hypothetical protein